MYAHNCTITRTSLSSSCARTASIQIPLLHTAICPCIAQYSSFKRGKLPSSECMSRTRSSCISPTEQKTTAFHTNISTQKGNAHACPHTNSCAATTRSHEGMGAGETPTKTFIRKFALEGKLATPRRRSGRRREGGVLSHI